jgi:hypothetical protein
MSLTRDNTPVEIFRLGGRKILVKREDLCCPAPGPSFSKIRGVVAHIENLPPEIKTVGCLDTFHSKAGWAVAYVCAYLGKTAVDFWPVYKGDTLMPPEREQQQRALDHGAKLEPIKAGRSAILFHGAKKALKERYPDSYMMPNALKLPESITENAAEVHRTELPVEGQLVISVSSGTIAAGVLKGFHERGMMPGWDIILHMGYSRSPDALRAYIEKKAGIVLRDNVEIVDEGYGYKDRAKDVEAPFPCNQYYDLKTWKWLEQNVQHFDDRPILFWNIGD